MQIFLFPRRHRDNISRPIVVTIFSGSRFLINREVVKEREGTCPKSLVSWLAHVTRTLLRGTHNQLEKAREKDGGRNLLFSAKVGCINRPNSKCKILIEHCMETDIVGSPLPRSLLP